jgi:lipoate---protein ligase
VAGGEKWQVETLDASAQEIHSLGVPEDVSRTLRVCVPTHPALILGSTQSEADVDMRAADELGVEIARRRSGGGAVLVDNDDIIWLDVLISRDDTLWNDDVGNAFAWLGNVVGSVLSAEFDVSGVGVHDGALIQTAWSRKICFAGLGPGECTVDDKKVVGISQRRTKNGALFQVAVNKRFDAVKLARLLDVPIDVMNEEIAESVGDLPNIETESFVDKLVHHMSYL